MRRKHIRAKQGPLKLWFDQKTNKWSMTGGQWGPHGLYETCYNQRVSDHWTGYIINNGLKPGPGSYGGQKGD